VKSEGWVVEDLLAIPALYLDTPLIVVAPPRLPLPVTLSDKANVPDEKEPCHRCEHPAEFHELLPIDGAQERRPSIATWSAM
jgi:hypothetical protein